ncbi:MAG TPA: ABC transporter ATP-binding protein [Actinomycetota bacterium]|nr:ABC transporter ATP-binding protein [Actinomycetota bacterium]
MTPLVHLEDVSKTFREGSIERPVLRRADLELHRGEMTSLVGTSGSGKSTLISLLAGLMLPDSGRVVFDGDEISRLDDVARAELRARRVGIVLQSGNLIPFLTATQNVELAMEFGARHDGARATELLTGLGVSERLDHVPRRMSGGEAQRVSMAVALANDPDLLLADEVTGQLDSVSAERVMDVIFSAWRSRGLTVLYVTHNAELASRAERRLMLEDGEVRDL